MEILVLSCGTSEMDGVLKWIDDQYPGLAAESGHRVNAMMSDRSILDMSCEIEDARTFLSCHICPSTPHYIDT